jgi:bifunctional UDP-N-acetylglucosamine pyrophosphorylase/glucosamine-1-phosphate N-acetyltransferase
MVGIAVEQGRHVEALVVEDDDECLGAGTRAELVAVEKAFRRRANRYWLDHGVTLVDPETIYIDPDVVIGQDTVIWPNSFLQGSSRIGERCIIGPNSIVRDARIGAGCRIEQAVVENTSLADQTEVTAFTRISGGQ